MTERRTATHLRQSRAVRLAARGGVLGPILFTALVILGAALYDGFSHVSQKISELGGEGARYALLQNVNFLLLGILVVGFSWALARADGRLTLGAALIGVFGVSSCIANALLPCDLACSGETTVGLLHNITGLAGFIAAIAGMIVLSRSWRGDPNWRSQARFTLAAAVVAIGGLVWFVATQALDAQSLAGIAQRTFIAALLTWIAVTAGRLTRDLGRANGLRSEAPVASD